MVVPLCQAHRWSPPGGARVGRGLSFSPVQVGARPGIPSLSPVALVSARSAFPGSGQYLPRGGLAPPCHHFSPVCPLSA